MGSILIGIPIGIFCSLFSWWVLFHLLSPKIRFSEDISKIKDLKKSKGFLYRVKFENYGVRKIVDVSFFITISITGLKGSLSKNEISLELKCKNKKRGAYINSPSKGGKRGLIYVDLESFDSYGEKMLPPYILKKINSKTVQMEELLSLGDDAFLELSVIGYDNFSGSKKVFTKRYKLEQVKSGYFEKNTLNIKKTQKIEKPDQDLTA